MTAELESLSFLHGTNETFVAELYARFLDDPASVDPGWQAFFGQLHDDADAVARERRGASWAPRETAIVGNGEQQAGRSTAPPLAQVPPPAPIAGAEDVRRATLDSTRALMLIRAYRVRGHLEARLDPLGLQKPASHPELDPTSYGFAEADYDRPIFINFAFGLESAPLHQILKMLRDTYCGSIGVEYMHIQEPDQKAWIRERIEGIRNQPDFTPGGRRAILERLIEAEGFERFLDKKYTGTKRFGLDGGETAVPALEQILKRGGQLGISEVVLGMAHRGRLNVLANIMRKPYQAIFSEFQGNLAHPDDVQGSADVKYHLGTSADRELDGNIVHLSLTANPSHLEAVNTVVLGKVRAKQRQRGDTEHSQVMALLLHGDAAFAGQGLVSETLDLSLLEGYQTGGTIHFVINNQIGFTTNPAASRSSPYCSDVAKIVQAPIFHVNGDDPEATVLVSRIATEFRQRFKSDVVIDMFCYRRHGHNEGDEPAFTQPLMYKKIKNHPTTREIYAKRLDRDGVVSLDESQAMYDDFQKRLGQDFEGASGYKPNKADWLEGKWTGFEIAAGEARRGDTAVELEVLREIGYKLTEPPSNFNLHPKILRFLKIRRKMIETGAGIDWSTGEALAFATLVSEGVPVRLSGQDSGRGTFSQRHAVLIDQRSEARHVPLASLRFGQAPFEVIDSPLSEAGVLGFEYGYSLAEPNMLVLWEAQFGDFANGAQVIIDQFVSSGEHKWLRMCGLVMLLPHGFEGQGPEHSSAKLERYLQLCGEDNMQVVNCSTPASLFHVLRRQMRRAFRKPLIVMTPKSLLRHKACRSTLDEMAPGTAFHRVMYDNEKLCEDAAVKQVVLCSGKVYYDLFAERAERAERRRGDIFFLRFEQLYPFPTKALTTELSRFKQARIVWCQEEPKNMGAWSFVEPRIEEVLKAIGARQGRARYVGRPEAAAPATGVAKRHAAEQKALVDEALRLE